MKKLPNEESVLIEPLAMRIWEDVVYSMDAYTNDSSLSKFYLPDEIISHCRLTAAAFAQIHFAPIPSREDVLNTRLFAVFYLAMTCGIQIYLKERSIFTNFSPYTIQADEKHIREIKNKIFQELTDGIHLDSPLDQVIALFLRQLSPIKKKIIRLDNDAYFNEELFDKFLPMNLIWGYLFAKKMILDY